MAVSLEGQETVVAMLEKLQAVGSVIKGVELKSNSRYDSPLTNAEVLEELKKQDRDFAEIEADEAERIAKAFADVAERFFAQNVDADPSVVASASCVAAMREYMKIVTENIEQGNIINDDLTPEYQTIKQKRFGFVRPIGKATGQLLDNLNPSEVKNIRPLIDWSKLIKAKFNL